MSEDPDKRLTLLELTLWGRTGANGVVGDLKAFRREFRDFVRAEEERREREEREEDERRERERQEKKSDRRWQVTTTIAIVTAIIVAAGIVAQAL